MKSASKKGPSSQMSPLELKKGGYGGGSTLLAILGKGNPPFVKRSRQSRGDSSLIRQKPTKGLNRSTGYQPLVNFRRTKENQKKRVQIFQQFDWNVSTVNNYPKKISLLYFLIFSNLYPSPMAAKQAIVHGHVAVNGLIKKYSNRILRVGDVVQIVTGQGRAMVLNYLKEYALAVKKSPSKVSLKSMKKKLPNSTHLGIHIDYKKLAIVFLWNPSMKV